MEYGNHKEEDLEIQENDVVEEDLQTLGVYDWRQFKTQAGDEVQLWRQKLFEIIIAIQSMYYGTTQMYVRRVPIMQNLFLVVILMLDHILRHVYWDYHFSTCLNYFRHSK